MIKEITIPDIGETVKSGQVVGILVSPGDVVQVEQGIIELETEKAVVEIPSPERGRITEVSVKEGDEVKVGQVIAKLDTDVEGSAATEETSEEKQPAEKPAAPKPSAKSGAKDAGEPARTSSAPRVGKKAPPTDQPRPVAAGRSEAAASPAVRRLARELGVDIDDITPSGDGGRITDLDVKNHVRRMVSGRPTPAPAARAAAGSSGAPSLPDFGQFGEIEVIDAPRVRMLVAQSVSNSWHLIPHVTQFDRADITHAGDFVKQYKAEAEAEGGRLTITAVLLKVVAAALQRYPKFNASIDAENGRIIYKQYCHVGIATDTDRGLLVPVIRDVDKKDIIQLAVELSDLSARTRDKKISPDEMEGGSFTISNQGGIGGTNFTPIVYWPQVAILGVSRGAVEPVYRDGEFEARRMLPLSLSYDHRIIDGADAVRFLQWIVRAIEHPLLLNF